jgi:ankyrin repeat protein
MVGDRLHEAAFNGNVAQVMQLLALPLANVDALNAAGSTALHYAASNGHVHVVLALLDAGADPTIADSNNQFTCLHCAAQKGHADVIVALLSHSSDDDQIHCDIMDAQVGHNGDTALIKAVLGNHVEAVKVLLGRGADVHRRNAFGVCALHMAECRDLIELLVDAGADANARDGNYETPILYAASGHVDAFEALVECGARVDAMSDGGSTPLSIAAKRWRVEIVCAMLLHYSLCASLAPRLATYLGKISSVLQRFIGEYRRRASLMLLCFDACESQLPSSARFAVALRHCRNRRHELLSSMSAVIGSTDLAFLASQLGL